ncbi:response regulator [Caulobacter mirabilis]|uniref:Two-component system response regulator n=1 Tax=Caulobacter mirabilis TaxID=69666 RepID=A0A2D2AW19_9CAUL|nr:two-component system response regulator [Caulobacter mirabilis]
MSALSKCRVLLVDDNKHARMFLSQILDAAGVEIAQAASGPEALTLLAAIRVDAVIADMYMQPMDGITLTAAIRASKDPMVSGLPVIMASAQTSKAIVEGGMAAGATGFLAKPFSPMAVLTRLEAALAPPPPPARQATAYI